MTLEGHELALYNTFAGLLPEPPPRPDLVVFLDADTEVIRSRIARRGIAWRIARDGRAVEAQVVSPVAAKYLALMPTKAAPDLSRFLLSPMPGLLTQIAVAPGQQVRAGERLATIEAMKMENALFAAQDCVVAELLAKQGESLAVDQPIIRFQ